MRHILCFALGIDFGRHFLAVQSNGHRMGFRTCGLDQANRLSNSRTCTHHIVHDQHPPFKRRTHQGAALAMVFGFLAVVGKGHIAPQPGQFGCHHRAQGNAFVGRAKQHVEFNATGQNVLRIETGQPRQLGAIVKQTGIEKIRR